MDYYTINDRSLADLVWQALLFAGGVESATVERPLLESAAGGPFVGLRTRLAPRTLTLSLDLRPPTMPQRAALMDALARRLSGQLTIVRDDAPDRAWTGVLQTMRVELPAGNLVNPLTLVDLTFSIPDPRRWDRDVQIRALSSTAVACPTGTGASAPTIRLFGAATPVVNPAVVLRHPGGAVLSTLSLTGSLGADTWLEVDGLSEWLHLVTAGVRANALGWLSGGAFPRLDGDDAAGPLGPYPTLALTATSGTPTGVVTWRRSWM